MESVHTDSGKYCDCSDTHYTGDLCETAYAITTVTNENANLTILASLHVNGLQSECEFPAGRQIKEEVQPNCIYLFRIKLNNQILI